VAVNAQSKKEDAYQQLWSRSALDDGDDDDGEAKEEEDNKWSVEEAQELGEFLTGLRLGGVTGPEQMQLLAVAEALAKQANASQDLDTCALRFTLAQRVKALAKPPAPLGPAEWLWALHSEAQDTLIKNSVPDKVVWPLVRELGLALWARNPTVVRQITERLAKTAFVGIKGDKRDPMEAAMWYLALDKKTALLALLKAVRDQRMIDFFSRDFTREDAQLAALKNAYHLLGKRRYELAVAFFLIAGREQLKAALNVCVKDLGDLHLAIWLARLVEGDGGPQLTRIIEEHLLPLARSQAEPWLESIALWLLKRHQDALSSLLESSFVASSSSSSLSSSSAASFSSPQIGVERVVPRRRPRQGDASNSSVLTSTTTTTTTSSSSDGTSHTRASRFLSSVSLDFVAAGAGGLKTREVLLALPRALEQGQQLSTPALLQVYRVLRANPLLRQELRSVAITGYGKDKEDQDGEEPLLASRALYAFLHSGAALHALALALALDSPRGHHLLVSAVAQLVGREVFVASSSSALSPSSPPALLTTSRLQSQLTSCVVPHSSKRRSRVSLTVLRVARIRNTPGWLTLSSPSWATLGPRPDWRFRRACALAA